MKSSSHCYGISMVFHRTGLIRFCHRDYDPTVGRFTAPDPLGDTGGDHDLYDYCVDEPVGRVDPEGLFLFPLLLGLGGLAGATGLAWGGVKTAEKGAEIAAETMGDDTLKAELPEKVEAMDKGATDAMTKVTAINAGIGATAAAAVATPTLARGAAQAAKAAPEAIAAAAGKGAEMAGKVGSAMANSADTAKQAAVSVALDPGKLEGATEFISSATPGIPTPTWPGIAGFSLGQAEDAFDLSGKITSAFKDKKGPIKIEE